MTDKKPTKKRGNLRAVQPDESPLQPWQQQPKETAPAFEAFRLYLEMGPERTQEAVAKKLGKSATLIARWSAKWNWVFRVAAHQAEAVKRADDFHMDAIADRAKAHAQAAQSMIDALVLPGKELLRRIEDNPEYLHTLEREALIHETTAAARALNRVVVTERLALGVSTENVGGHDGGPIDAEARALRERTQRMDLEELDEFLGGRIPEERKAS